MYCVSCGRRFKPPYKHTKHCESCIITQPPDLVVDIGAFHLEAHSEYLPAKRIDKLISKCCKYASELQKRGTS